VTSPIQETRDPADARLAARAVEGVEADAATPAEEELVQRVRDDRARARRVGQRLAVAGLAAIALVAALIWSRRSERAPMIASAPPEAAGADATTAPREPASAPPGRGGRGGAALAGVR
jgi:hypothetical protein